MFILAWIMSLAFGQAALSRPRLLEFLRPEADLGQLRFDAGNVKVDFTYTNISDTDVDILDVHTQCGCASPSWEHRTLRPGQSAVMSVVYDPSHFIGPQKVGLTVIATNGEYKKYNTLVLRAEVLRDLTLEQARHPYIMYGDLRCDMQTLGFRLTERGAHPVRAMEIYNDSPEHTYSIEFLPQSRKVSIERSYAHAPLVIEPGRKVSVEITVDTSRLPDGPYEDYVAAVIDSSGCFPVILKGAVRK